MPPSLYVNQITLQVLGIVITFVATVTAVRVGLGYLERRVDKAEARLDKLPGDYVPRSEVELGLQAIRETVDNNYELLKTFLGRSIHAAAEAPPEAPEPLPPDPLDELTAWAKDGFARSAGREEARVEYAKVLAICFLAQSRRDNVPNTSR